MEIVLVGRSNVGKSSVIKQLTGKKVTVGRRPGITRRISCYPMGSVELTDMPGFGFMSGVPKLVQERIKTEIISYVENNRKKIVFALEIVDARSFQEIAERWSRRGQIPVDVEMFHFLEELELNPVIVANKIDLIYPEERDAVLDGICAEIGLTPPWRQWSDVIVPISAKTGEGINDLKKFIKSKLQELKKSKTATA